jgi:hypothetical protein
MSATAVVVAASSGEAGAELVGALADDKLAGEEEGAELGSVPGPLPHADTATNNAVPVAHVIHPSR